MRNFFYCMLRKCAPGLVYRYITRTTLRTACRAMRRHRVEVVARMTVDNFLDYGRYLQLQADLADLEAALEEMEDLL